MCVHARAAHRLPPTAISHYSLVASGGAVADVHAAAEAHAAVAVELLFFCFGWAARAARGGGGAAAARGLGCGRCGGWGQAEAARSWNICMFERRSRTQHAHNTPRCGEHARSSLRCVRPHPTTRPRPNDTPVHRHHRATLAAPTPGSPAPRPPVTPRGRGRPPSRSRSLLVLREPCRESPALLCRLRDDRNAPGLAVLAFFLSARARYQRICAEVAAAAAARRRAHRIGGEALAADRRTHTHTHAAGGSRRLGRV